MKIEWKEEKGLQPKILLLRDGERVRTISPRVISLRDVAAIHVSTWEEFEEALLILEEKGGIRLALSSLSRRSYPSQKLRDLLKKHFLHDVTVDKIITWCMEKGYLDDTSWVEQRISSLRARGKSSQDISYRLRREGIHSSLQDDDTAVLKKLIQKKYPQLLQQDLPYKEKAKAIQSLLRKGFSLQDIQELISDVP